MQNNKNNISTPATQPRAEHPDLNKYVLIPSRPRRYRSNRGGHAPGHLREAFVECLERFDLGESENWYDTLSDDQVLSFYRPEVQNHWGKLPAVDRTKWLTGQLWNCTDILPSSVCYQLELKQGSSYAIAARELRAYLPHPVTPIRNDWLA